jgi:hypothetical protein
MSCHSVSKILCIGPVTQRALESKGINTIGELSQVKPGSFSINNLSTFIHRAKNYIKEREDTSPQTKEQKILIGGNNKTDKTPSPSLSSKTKNEVKLPNNDKKDKQNLNSTPAESNDEKEEEDLKVLIEDHTWWERKILIPSQTSDIKLGYELKEAIIYEMSLEKYNRISFICSWVVKKNEDVGEQLCTMTYSPQFILYFNSGTDLPELNISVTKEFWDELDNRFTIQNTLLEANIIQRFNAMKV